MYNEARYCMEQVGKYVDIVEDAEMKVNVETLAEQGTSPSASQIPTAGHTMGEWSLLKGHMVADDDTNVNRVEELANDRTAVLEKKCEEVQVTGHVCDSHGNRISTRQPETRVARYLLRDSNEPQRLIFGSLR